MEDMGEEMSSDKKARELFEYLLSELVEHKREFRLTADLHHEGGLQIYIHPMSKDGKSLDLHVTVASTDSPLDQDVWKEIEEAAELKFKEDKGAFMVLRMGYKEGAREFIKRTEERVWREAVEFARDEMLAWPKSLEDEGKRLGYIK